METVVDQLVKGQGRLEWVLEQHLVSAQADREILKKAIEEKQPWVDPVSRSGTTERTVTHGAPTVSLQKYRQGEDPDAFLLNFERAARACGWPVAKWPFFLAPLLGGEAQAAYQVANPRGDNTYVEIKKIILDHLGLDPEAYRLKFRKERGSVGENPKTLFVRLKMAADKWLTPTTSTKEEILDRIYLEQFLEALPYATQKWLRQHNNLTTTEAVEMASSFTRAQPRNFPCELERKGAVRIEKPVARGRDTIRPRTWRSENTANTGPQCFDCGQWGHIARMCPKRKNEEEPMEVGYLPRAVLFSAEMGGSFRNVETEVDTQSTHWPFNSEWTSEWEESLQDTETSYAGMDESRVCLFTQSEEGDEEEDGSRAELRKDVYPEDERRDGREARRGAVRRKTGPEERQPEDRTEDGKEGTPGGQRHHESPSHTPGGGVWLNQVRDKLRGWVTRKTIASD
ncbi:uncharacterized protein LOC144785619 [Lissotriton helveticus]